MPVFDALKSSPAPPPPASASGIHPFAVEPSRMYDLRLTGELGQLAGVPRASRDRAWSTALLAALWNGSIALPEAPFFEAPDGFVYLRLNLPTPGQPFDSNCLARQAELLVNTGRGAAFFASADAPVNEPVYVLGMGVLASLLAYGGPDGDPADRAGPTAAETAAPAQVLVGAPSASYLSPAVARALHRHLTAGWKLDDPRVALLVDPRAAPSRALVLGTTPAEMGIDEELGRQRLRTLGWYLPPGRALTFRPAFMKPEGMTPLATLFQNNAPVEAVS